MDEAAIKAAKDGRTKTKRLFTMSITSMDKSIRQDKPIEGVREKFCTICGHWRELSDKHATYTSLAFPEDDGIPTEEHEYIDELESAYDNAMMNCDAYIKNGSTLSKENTEAVQKQSRLLRYK